MIGISVPNSKHRPFQAYIDQDGILFLVEEISTRIHRHYPDATVRGIAPTIPAFP